MLKKLLVLPLVALILVSVQRPAKALIGTIDAVPAATLLVPYFEVDLDNPSGRTTLFSINNASATAILAHVTLWSDLGVPTFAYNVYLTGYDVQTINVRDVLQGINFGVTASAGQDPKDTISPKGAKSQDINFASCTGQLPLPNPGPDYVAHMRAAHTGGPSAFFLGKCSGAAKGDNVARGYITVDTVNNCTLRVAGQPGYFGPGGTGDVTNQNVLWGDVFYLDPGNNFASGDTAVHIEADATNPQTSVPGQYTFYGRYDAFTAADNREPLPTIFAARFINGGAFSGGTDLISWRDSKVNQQPFTCGVNPSWYPMDQTQVVVFDEQEQPVVATFPPFFPQPPSPTLVPFPGAANRTHVGGAGLPVPYSFGWLFVNMNTVVAASSTNPPEDPTLAQAWVMPVHSANGRYSVGYAALQLGNPANPVASANFGL